MCKLTYFQKEIVYTSINNKEKKQKQEKTIITKI